MNKETKISAMPWLVSNSDQYFTDKGRISLVGPCEATFGNFEIYCIKGNHFDDIERYSTEEEAMERISFFLE